jgi:hypothetical protein
MHLLISVILKGDVLPLCVFTAKNLRFLEDIQLGGKVNWPSGALNARMLRPNLRHVFVDPMEHVPAHIIDELQWWVTKQEWNHNLSASPYAINHCPIPGPTDCLVYFCLGFSYLQISLICSAIVIMSCLSHSCCVLRNNRLFSCWHVHV